MDPLFPGPKPSKVEGGISDTGMLPTRGAVDAAAFEKLLERATSGKPPRSEKGAETKAPDAPELPDVPAHLSRVTPLSAVAGQPPAQMVSRPGPGEAGPRVAGPTAQDGAPPPVLGQPPPQATRVDAAGEERRRAVAERRKRSGGQAEKGETRAGVQATRLMESLERLLRIASPHGNEKPAADFVVVRVSACGLEHRVDETGNVVVEVPASGPALLFAARLDADDPLPEGALSWHGGEMRSARPCGLHARAGAAILLEMLEVAAARLREGGKPPCAMRAVFAVDGENLLRGARGLDAGALDAVAALCLDGFVVDEVLETQPWQLSSDLRMNAREARRVAERRVAEQAAAGDGSMDLRRRVDHCLARIGIPTWTGRMPAEGTAASVFLARGIPAFAVGVGVINAHVADETFILSDAVLCTRLLLAVAETYRG